MSEDVETLERLLRDRPPGWWDRVCAGVPEVAALRGVPQPLEYHGEGDVAEHTRLAVEAVPAGSGADLLWAALLHDLGKAVTTRVESGTVLAHGHDRVGAELAGALLDRVGAPAARRETIVWFVRHHLFHFSWNRGAGAGLSRRQLRYVRDPRFPMLLELLRADSLASLGAGSGLRAYEHYRKLWAQEMTRAAAKEDNMTKALIVSVGGTPEPVARAIVEHRPQVVCFVCSEDSVEKIAEAKRLAGEAAEGVRSRVVMVSDPQDLVACYREALTAADRVDEAGVPPEDVVVDYTGGTKTMSAALALATVGKGYRFSYVGGRERDKGGLGVVLDGAEEVRTGVSPWRLFAVEEKRAFADLFNRHLFASAEEVLARAVRHDAVERDLLEALLRLARGYRHWDAFRHGPAKEELSKGLPALDTWVRLRPGAEGLADALDAARANLDFLSRLQEGTRGFQRGHHHRLQVADLLSNARRRAEVGRHDDAVARVYRALEFVGQLAFEEAFGCETGAAEPGRLPEALRDEYAAAYADRDGRGLCIPSFAVFRALEAAGRAEGLAYFARRTDFDKLLSSRNYSILAHGFEPVAADLPERFEGLVRETFGIAEVIEFPRFAF